MNEKIDYYIENLVNEIKDKNFDGSKEEVIIKQILWFDNYVKNNIDYGFDAVFYYINNPNEINPYGKAFTDEGFFEENSIDGRRLAVCGSISAVAKRVFSKLGVDIDYIYGHIGNVGHRWNIIKLNDKVYMVDFTLSLVKYKYENEEYMKYCKDLFKIEDFKTDFDFLFFDKLIKNETIGGFKIGANGHEDNLDENGNLVGITNNPYEIFRNLSTIPVEKLQEYIEEDNYSI